eukprot:64855-Chlamydomonas_euryale.AAC.1
MLSSPGLLVPPARHAQQKRPHTECWLSRALDEAKLALAILTMADSRWAAPSPLPRCSAAD